MANVIKHKRGSGSDPSASNLVVGELAIRTDTGKLFTKMDSGALAEIAGGGSDIAINTLSSSSATGGGSATFNGSAYRFTLSSPPSVSAAQLLVSINGVIQKPVAGTGQPSEGFSVDGNDIILGDAPATGSDFFILTFRSLGVSVPADNSVTSAKIVDGAIVNADINASAAIAGTKISPDFGSQAITTTGNLNAKDIVLTDTAPLITFNDSDHENDFVIGNFNGTFIIQDADVPVNRFTVATGGQTTITGNLDCNAGLDVTGAITGTGDLTIDTNTLHVDSSNNRVGIGTTNPAYTLDVNGSTAVRVANSTSYQTGFNVTNSVTTDLQVWIKNNAVALGPSTASEINFVTGGNTGTRLSIAADGVATFSKNIVLEGGSSHAYPHIRLHSSAANVRKWTIYNGQSWNPDALLIYDTDGDSTALTIEPGKLGVNKGANSLTETLEVGGNASITGNLIIGTNGKGIDFSATGGPTNGTGSSELLDDYEEGTFTPTLKSNTTTTGQQSGIGKYTKVGNMVHCIIDFEGKDFSSIPDGGVVGIVNMPFTSAISNYTPTATVPMMYNIYTRQNETFYIGSNSTTVFGIYPNSGTGWSNIPTNDINQSSVYLNFSLTYFTA